ncbi:MAG TPA: class I SAM-dependent methyltransferase [Bacteroidota bacterium]|nr:class I SAM-dependent methyltransferase [Bacteroidota bacterium]
MKALFKRILLRIHLLDLFRMAYSAISEFSYRNFSQELRYRKDALPDRHPAPPLRFDSEYFDLIIARSVLIHLDSVLQRRRVEEFHRLLKPGGYLCVTTHGPG